MPYKLNESHTASRTTTHHPPNGRTDGFGWTRESKDERRALGGVGCEQDNGIFVLCYSVVAPQLSPPPSKETIERFIRYSHSATNYFLHNLYFVASSQLPPALNAVVAQFTAEYELYVGHGMYLHSSLRHTCVSICIQ